MGNVVCLKRAQVGEYVGKSSVVAIPCMRLTFVAFVQFGQSLATDESETMMGGDEIKDRRSFIGGLEISSRGNSGGDRISEVTIPCIFHNRGAIQSPSKIRFRGRTKHVYVKLNVHKRI